MAVGSIDFHIDGAKQFHRAAQAAANMGKTQRREVLKAIQAEVKPMKAGIKGSALATLPKRGGLNEVVASSTISARTDLKGTSTGVTFRARGRTGRLKDIRATDRGRLRHPVFADPTKARTEWTWVNQVIESGWWSKPLAAFGPKLAKDLGRAMTRVVDDIARRSK